MRTVSRSVSLLALASAALSAHASIIDFENLSNPNVGPYNYQGNPVVSDGFSFQDNGLNGFFSTTSNGVADGYVYTGSVALLANDAFGTITMTQVGGAAFTLNRMGVANLATAASGNGQGSSITFTGTKMGGGTVTSVFNVAAGDALQTASFSGFTNLTSVSWMQNPNFHQFDNIVVNASSVPGPLAALPFALMAIRRRKA